MKSVNSINIIMLKKRIVKRKVLASLVKGRWTVAVWHGGGILSKNSDYPFRGA